MNRLIAIGFWLLALGGPVALAWQTPVRDAPAQPVVGTASVSGTLLTDDREPRPVRRAVVSLTPLDSRMARMTVTDDEGRFVFGQLPAGMFTIQASKPGFLTAYYGAKRPGRGPGVPVVVADGQRVQVTMRVLKGAVIAGAVVDQEGRPAANAGLQLLQVRTIDGRTELVGAFGGYGYESTDDRGFYRAYGLPPGEYLVAVTGRTFGSGGMHEVTASEIRWAEQQFAATSAAGPTRLAADTRPSSAERVTAAPVYFPGTVDITRAQFVTVGPGEERTGVNFAIQYVPTARIEGTVTDAAGQPAQTARVSLVATSLVPGDFIMAMSSAGRATVVNGRFRMTGIAPGRYTITAQATPTAGVTLWALQSLTVDGRDISDVSLRLEPGLGVAGRIVFSGAQPAPLDLSRIRITLRSLQTPSGVTLTVPATIAADGTFTVPGLIPGQYRVSVSPPAGASGTTPWTLKSAMVNGRDGADVPVEIGPGGTGPELVVTFTDRSAELSGTVLDLAGRPTPEYSIVVFPTDKAMWLSGARRIRAVRLSSAGTFSIPGLPAGEYFLSAATDYDTPDLSDPAFLGELATASLRVTLNEGEKKRQDLRVTR